MTAFGIWWNSVPAFLRDFIEGTIAAAIGGASGAVLGLNLDTATPRGVASAALVGAISAVIAYARHRLPAPPPAI